LEQVVLRGSGGSFSHGVGYGTTLGLQPEAVAAFLATRWGVPVEEVEAIGLGQWSKAFGFRRGGGRYIVRFSPIDEDFRKDYRAMGYASAGLPIPRIIEMGEAFDFDGYFAISERASGDFLEHLDEAGMRRLLPSLLATWDALRQVDISSTGGFGVWRGDGSGPHPTWHEALLAIAADPPGSRTHGWRERLPQSPLAARAFEAGFQRVHSLLEYCPNDRYLVHSDLLYYNVLVADDRISAVLDWGSSLYGDFLWDLAWFTFWQPWYPAWAGIDFAREARRHFAEIGFEVRNFEQRLRCYELCIGLDGMAYQAFRARWSDCEATARRTLGLSGQ
jgi:hygromycin-B 4-O-kinase